MVLNDYFERHRAEIPDHDALVFKDRRITYQQYDDETDRVAMGLLKLGVKRGDRIGIYAPLNLDSVITFFGAIKVGAIVVSMSARTTAPELQFLLNDAGISVLFLQSEFMGSDFMGNLEKIRGEANTLEKVVCYDQEPKGGLLWDKFLTEPDSKALQKAADLIEETDPAIFIYTSGTTGTPKGAILTHKNLISATAALAHAADYGRSDSIVLNLPLSHVGGAVMGVTLNLYAGGKLVLMELFDPEETIRLISEERATLLGQVPAMFAMELNHPNIGKYDLGSLKTAIVSSQPCPSDLIVTFKKQLGITPLNAYGLTEVSAAITYTPRNCDEEKLTHSVGKPVPSVQLVLKDRNGEVVSQGQAGEICVKGPMVMKGYWNRPEEDAKVFDEEGFLHTGDIGKFDNDGFLYIVGRSKEMYIRGGENVYPPEIEEVITQHPEIMLAAVIGRPHDKWGEVGRAYVMPVPEKNPTPESIREFLKQRLSHFKIPEDIIVQSSLPLTPLGKVKKLDLYNEVKKEFEK